MDLNKYSECLKYYLAQVFIVECSAKPEKEDTGKHPDFFSLCQSLWILHVRMFWRLISLVLYFWTAPVRPSERKASSASSFNSSSVLLLTCASNCSRADPAERPKCIHSKLQTQTMKNRFTIYFLGEQTHKNNVFCWRLETTAQKIVASFSSGGGQHTFTAAGEENPLWSLVSTITPRRRRRRRRRHEQEADSVQHLSPKWDRVDQRQIVQVLAWT